MSFFFWKTSPTLRLLSTPWEYFVTIDQSALWQKHIAWAKPMGSDLKAYISSQYSSRMVLLSLLLATEMSVFFNSSPALINLRQHLNIWGDNSNNNNNNNGDIDEITAAQGILPFWIGFFLLLNICVTISGILATFATWNVVSAISDTNAHCLLRSSLGQYVATLSPRLVVASLYLFLLWFLLFVVELLFGDCGAGAGGHNKRGLHVLLTKHLHLVILWACFLVAVTALFFSIVVPLSAFGRLVLHTGAMAEQPVLSESLQVELLPRGLHAGLVIRAHHSQKRRKTVTKQYQQRKQKQRKHRLRQNQSQRERLDDDEEQNQREGFGEMQQQDQDGCDQERQSNNNNNIIGELPFPPIDDFGDTFMGHSHEEGHGQDGTAGSSGCSNGDDNNDDDGDTMIGNTNKTKNHDNRRNEDHRMDFHRSTGTNEPSNYFYRFHQEPEIFNSDHQHEKTFSRNQTINRDLGEHRWGTSSRRRHRRMSTTDTMISLNLPPATILNLSMTAREFHDVIDSAVDTSSLCTRSPIISTTGIMEEPAMGHVYPCGGDTESPLINNHFDSERSIFLDSTEERRRRSNGSSEEGCNRNGEHHNYGRNTSKKQTKAVVLASHERHSRMSSGKHRGGIKLSSYPTSTATARAGGGAMDAISNPSHHRNISRNHQDLVTRHHRRVSSSRFLLEEWAQENRVRDMYGAAPSADLPHEIAWLLENENQSDNDTRCRQPETPAQNEADGTLPQDSPADIINTCTGEPMPSAPNPSRNLSQQHWLLSPFSSPFGARNKIPNKIPNRSNNNSMHRSMLGSTEANSMVGVMEHSSQSVNREGTLKEPLLPDLTAFRDEELGGESSELLGESLLRSEGDRKQSTSIASNRRNMKESASGIG
jgi:hypothetical protein